MKIIHTAFLCLFAFNSSALTRNSPTPQLHSILDSPEKAKPYLEEDGWARRMAAEPKKNELRLIQYKVSREVMRNRGTVLTIIGSVLLATAGGLWLYADAETRRQQANGGRSYTLPYYGGAALAGVSGTVLVCVGLPIWLFNSGK